MQEQREPRVTLKQERFADAIVSGEAHSLADAARLAGYVTPDAHHASVQGSQAMASIGVQRAIQERRHSLAEQAGISARSVLERIEKRANGGDTADPVPHSTRQRADEVLVDILNLRDQQGAVVDARSLTLAVTSADVRELARLILGDDITDSH